MPPTAVMVGRFQPLHKGHEALLDAIRQDWDSIAIGITKITDDATVANPLSIDQRRACLEAVVDEGIFIIHEPRPCATGVTEVEARLGSDIIAVGCNDETLACFKSQGHPVQAYDRIEPERYDGSLIRERIRDDGDWRTLVPDPVVTVLEQNGGIEAIRSA